MREKGLILAALVLILLAGCATARGIGEDLQSLGRGLRKTVDEQEERRR